ncbi:MAG: acyl-CoA dehydrogenase family protein [Candidatus Eisenbacteria bacterium]|nr:acyl-CoA dehydrogenase family protein [Candidatus Eisenbacteria bacterium]
MASRAADSCLPEWMDWIRREIAPHAGEWDAAGHLPQDLPLRLAEAGLLALAIPAEYGGRECDPLTYGRVHAELGAACASTRALLTVHDMVASAIARWGDEVARRRWLPALARGERLGAFALTEPGAGSDARAITTRASREEDGFVLSGHKHWISFAPLAGLLLVFARCEEQASAFLVPLPTKGVRIQAMPAPLGMRASLPGEIEFEGCRLGQDALLGRIGAGLSHIAATALALGRYGVAWGCVGIQRACLASAVDHARERVQFGKRLCEHEMIQEQLARMAVDLRASELLCEEAGRLRAERDPEAFLATALAKTHASQAAQRASERAVQILGARGCAPASAVQRHFRDAKVMEIIEGSTEIQHLLIANDVLRRHGGSGHVAR